mgnify:CR=1 FL=1
MNSKQAKEFIKKKPHIRISIACHPTYQTLAALEDGSIDIGLVGEPDTSFPHIFSRIHSIEDVFVTTQSYLDKNAIF